MTTPGGGGTYSAGTIFLQVVPSFRDFQNTIRKAAKDMDKAFAESVSETEIADALDKAMAKAVKKTGKEQGDRLGKDLAQGVKGQLDRFLKNTALAMRVDINDTDATKKLDRFQKRAVALLEQVGDSLTLGEAREFQQGLDDLSRGVERVADTSDAMADRVRDNLRTIASDLRKQNGELAKAEQKIARRGPGVDTANQQGLQKKLLTTITNLAPIKLNFDGNEAEAEVIRIAERMEALLQLTADVDLSADDLVRIERDFRALAVQINDIDRKDISIQARADVDKAVADLRRLDNAADSGGLENFIQRTQGASQALRGFNALVLIGAAAGPALIPVLGALAAGMLALGTAALGAAAGIGVAILAFSGVGDAVKALGKQQEDGAEQARALAKTQRAAANAVGDAERSLVSARRAGADAAAAAAERVEDAQRAIVRAHQDARQGVQTALRGIRNAERDLARAQRDSIDAQEELRQVRKQAERDLADLESRVKGGALAERQALVDLFEAQVAYNAVRDDGGATNLEREQAAIALERARLAISDQRRENVRLREEQKKATTEGVEGNEQVVQARERQVDQAQRIKDAEEELRDARERLQLAHEQGAEKIADAQERLSDALRAQANAGVANNEAIAAAQRNLTEAQLNYSDALAQTTASADAVADAMAKLSPAGQIFAEFIFGLRDEFAKLRGAAQEGLLPGVQQAIQNLLPFMPQITAFVGKLAGVMGDLAVQASKALTSPIYVEFFRTISDLAPTFVKQFAGVFGNLLTIFVQLATAFAPLAVKIGDALVGLTDSFVAFLDSEKGQEMLADFMDFAQRVGPKVADFFGALGGALVNLFVALAPYGEVILGIFTGILNFIAGLPPGVLGAIVFGFLSLVFAFQALAGLLGALGAVMGIIATIGDIFFIGAAAALGWVAAIAAVVIGLGILYAQSETFRDIVGAALNAVGAVISFLWYKIAKPIFGLIVDTLTFMGKVFFAFGDLAVKAFGKLGGVIKDFYEKNLKVYVDAIVIYLQEKLGPAFTVLVGVAQAAWDAIANIFKDTIKFVVDVAINQGLIGNFNKLADFFGSKTIPAIKLPGFFYDQGGPKSSSTRGGRQEFATGGSVLGFSPSSTADNIPAWLTAGEYVLPVEAVKKLRAAFGDQFLEWLRGGGGFAKGGLVEFGRLLQSRAFRVSEHPAFGGVRGKHAANSFHYKGQAIDVNYGPGGTSSVEQRAIDSIIGLAKEYDLRTIWRTQGHFNHAHFDTGGSGGSLIGRLADFIGDAVEWAKDGPIGWLKDKVLGVFGGVTDNPLGQLVIGFGKKMIDNALGGVKTIAGLAGDFVDDDPTKPAQLYDQGGWLPPGMTQVVNATGRPELILTPDQADTILKGGGQYSITVPMMPTNATPAEVADSVLFAARQIARGGVYAGRR